jgi:hypothetical protein
MSRRRCEKFEKALARGEEAIAALAPHAAECSDCRAALDLWSAVPEAARALPKRWETPHLFPGIARAIETEKSRSKEAPRAPRRFAWIPAAAAAALFVLSMIGLYVFKPGEAARDPLARPSFGKEPLLGDETLKEVEAAEANYLGSIEKLSRLAEPRISNPDLPGAAGYREKLQLLDSAIGDLQAQLATNRFNTHLRKELLATYQEKKRTLEEVIKEVKS